MANHFEIKIVKDSHKNEADVHSMSLEVAKAFLILVESVTKIIENTPNNENLRIDVKKGSVKLLVQGDGIERLQESFLSIVNRGSADKLLVDSWRTMQNLFKQNGLEYEAIISTDQKQTRVYDTLKGIKSLRAKPVKRQIPRTNIQFFEATLFKIGGENLPMLYLNVGDNKRIRVHCSKESAVNAKKHLYQSIYVSCWVSKNEGKMIYKLCDSYIVKDDSPYHHFKEFIHNYEHADDELDSLDMVYDECLTYLKEQKYNRLKRFLKLFMDMSTDANTLHTISLLTHFFKEHQVLKENANRIESLLNAKIQYLNRTIIN
jgi:hypothetical protein